jgi:hypothetical protein
MKIIPPKTAAAKISESRFWLRRTLLVTAKELFDQRVGSHSRIIHASAQHPLFAPYFAGPSWDRWRAVIRDPKEPKGYADPRLMGWTGAPGDRQEVEGASPLR